MNRKKKKLNKSKTQWGSVLFAILKAIGDSTKNIAEFMVDPSSWDPTLAPKTTYGIPGYHDQAVKRWLARMRRANLIEARKERGQTFVSLTPQGKNKLLQFEVNRLTIVKQGRWDGIWRIVIFDIPEEDRRTRRALRSRMKLLGFEQLQKSVFVIPYSCAAEMGKLVDFFGLSNDHLRIIEATHFSGEEDYKKRFDF